MFRLPFLPRETKFFDLFERSAANLVDGAQRLQDLVEHYENTEEKVRLITECEHTGDGITHEIFDALHSTFIPPLDREDIVSLVQSMDDVMDFIESAADTMLLYKVERPTETAVRLAALVVGVCQEINNVMPLLRSKETMPRVLPATVTINSLENEADDVRREGLAILLERPGEVMEFVRWRDIYEQMESATDRGEDVANALEAIVLKTG